MDIREIQRLHEQFAHAPLTLEAPTSAKHSGGHMLPPPAYSAAGATRAWAARFGNARLVVSVVVGIVAAGALGMAIATWQHGRAAPPESTAPAALQVKPPPEEPVQAPPVAAAEVLSMPVAAKAQPVEPATKVAEPVATPAAPVVVPAPRSQPSLAPAARAAAPVARKVEPAPAQAQAQATQPTPTARRADSAAEIKLF
uniref:hypothetical protein n=1 Tax=Cupriavidus necator TaxID=106590 RepID=UPI003F49751E